MPGLVLGGMERYNSKADRFLTFWRRRRAFLIFGPKSHFRDVETEARGGGNDLLETHN